MSGSRVSMPYWALPVVMSGPSTSLRLPLPMYRNLDGSFRRTVSRAGTVWVAAAWASEPKLARRPDLAWITS
jgi:hypothetical protein